MSTVHTLHYLYEDEYLFVLNKPAGVHSVAHSAEELASDAAVVSLAGMLLKKDTALSQVSKKEGDGGLIQRLDLWTSGVIIGAKRREVWEALHGALLAGEIEKEYLLLVEGDFSKALTVKNFIGSPYRRAKKVRVYEEKPSDKHRALGALTHFSPYKTLRDDKECFSLITAKAPTARRHQVRAHAASIGFPLVGDLLYGSTKKLCTIETGEIGAQYKTREFFLHAAKSSFVHPKSGKKITVEAKC